MKSIYFVFFGIIFILGSIALNEYSQKVGFWQGLFFVTGVFLIGLSIFSPFSKKKNSRKEK